MYIHVYTCDSYDQYYLNCSFFSCKDTSSGVKLYLNELMEQISPNVSAQSWEIKRTAANALSTIAEKTGMAHMKQ